jgi:Flp pilus assembly protein TadB
LRFVALVALLSILPLAAPCQTTATSTPKKAQHKTRSKKARSKASAANSGKSTAKRGKKSKKAAAAWRSRQLAPTPDRYKEIQSALAARGYLKESPNGVWDDESADALRRFQHDQSLDATGKLNSLSLIALGLGAKHGSTGVAPAASPVPATSPRAPALPGPAPAPQTSAPATPQGTDR